MKYLKNRSNKFHISDDDASKILVDIIHESGHETDFLSGEDTAGKIEVKKVPLFPPNPQSPIPIILEIKY